MFALSRRGTPARKARVRRDSELAALLAPLPDDSARFAEACSRVTDWDGVFESAVRHGVHDLLFGEVRAAGVPLRPDLELRLRRQTFLQRARLQPLHAALAELLDAVARDGVPAAVLKGPVLAERLYADPMVRPSVDVDLLVAEQDLDRAVTAIAPLGYFSGNSTATERFNRTRHYHLSFLHPDREHIVEIHFHALRAFGAVVPAAELLSRAVPYPSAYGPTRVLAPEDELIYLAVHAAKHAAAHFKWLYDLKLFLRRHQELDWDAVRSRAREMGVDRALAFALADVDRIVGGVPAGTARSSHLAEALRGACEDAAERGPAATLYSLAYAATLADRWTASASVLGRGLSRIARRRAQRYFPSVVPEHWSG